MLVALAAALWLRVPSWAAPSTPPAYQNVLSRHALDLEMLRAKGFVFDDGRCFRADAAGRPAPPALSPDELDAALGLTRAAAPVPAEPEKRPLALKSDEALRSLRSIWDAASVAVAPVPAPPALKPPYSEPPFEGDWKAIEAEFKDPKRRARGVRALSARFREDDESATGLSVDAPEALRLIALAVKNGAGEAAAGELRRELSLVADLQPAQKSYFARGLTSPLTVYVALSRSHAAHSVDSQLYFRRMTQLLAADGRTLTSFISDADPKGRDAREFLLRAHAYDALLPYLNQRPAEAGAIVPFLFPDGSARAIRARASQLEGLMTQLAAQGRASGALGDFITGLEARMGSADGDVAARIALYLKVNEPILPKKYRARLASAASRLPDGLLDASGLAPADPRESWPADAWTFVLQFANPPAYNGWLARFSGRGYAQEALEDGATMLKKTFAGVEVRLVARLYDGDEEGFMHDEVARQFLSDVRRDLRDPSIQGVILRNHAQFNTARLFGKGVKDKLVLDGACRSAWDLRTLRRACPSCSFIVNTGTGRGHLNNAAVIAVIEGLAEAETWNDIGARWNALSPSSARIQGPWTPPFAEALALLEKVK